MEGSKSPFRSIRFYPCAVVAAQRGGAHNKFISAIFAAIWEDDQDISKPEILIFVLNEAGLNGAALVAPTQEPKIKLGLRDSMQACLDRGVFGLLSLFPGEDLYFGED
ncbi:DsbA family protein [Robiginitomaculum antarcticum]|uniref:DsbA family protein n=1 Tax=Robiginitomaculum antarcticum TaxID=437507 RepID=UPI00039DCBCD|nr:DsbA family protein [Robiginitomaculum antarcticum]